LRPLTNDKPKSTLLINGKSIIEWQLRNLPSQYIKNIIIIVGYEAEQLKSHIKSLNIKENIKFIKNQKFIETNCAFSLLKSKKYFNTNSIIINCDLLFSIKTIKRLCQMRNNTIVCVRKNDGFQTDLQKVYVKNDKIISWALDLIENNAEIMGPVKISINHLKKITKYFESCTLDQQLKMHCFTLFSECLDFINYKPLFINDTDWKEIDNKDDYMEAKRLILDNKLKIKI